MNKVFKIPILLFIAVCCIQSSCKKDNSSGDGLPPLTFEGKNTIGCKINGVPWVPKGIYDFSGIQYPVVGGFYGHPSYPGTHVRIRTNDPGNTIDLFLRNYSGTDDLPLGIYYMNRNTQSLYGYYEKHSYGLCNYNSKEYITDSLHTGRIEILKSDRQTGIVSGRFEFEAYNVSENKTVKITDGRFDVK